MMLVGSSRIGKQKGVVLIVALVFLIALTAVVAALMQNTTTDMKMAGASEARVEAVQETISAVDEIIFNQATATTGNNDFAQALVKMPIENIHLDADRKGDVATSNKDGKITVSKIDTIDNDFLLETDCPHSRSASSVQVFTCNILRVQVTRTYGRTDSSTVDANSGIAQPLLR